MTTQEFAQKVRSKYPQYNSLSDTALVGDVVSKYPQYKDQISDYNEGSFTKGMESTGMFNIPVLGGLLRSVAQPASQLAETAGADLVGAGHKIAEGVTGKKIPFQAPFISPEEYAATLSPQARQQNPIQNGAGFEAQQLPSQAGALLTADGIAEAPGAVKGIASVAKNAPKYLTKGSTWNQVTKAVEGAAPDWGKVVSSARSDAADEATSVKKALEKLIKQENPTAFTQPGVSGTVNATGESAPWTGKQALNLRVGLGKRLPSSFLDALTKKVPSEEKAAIGILRRAVSGELKRAAPDIKTPDKVYSFYSKIHGDAPTWAKRLVVAEALKHLGANIPGFGAVAREIPVP